MFENADKNNQTNPTLDNLDIDVKTTPTTPPETLKEDISYEDKLNKLRNIVGNDIKPRKSSKKVFFYIFLVIFLIALMVGLFFVFKNIKLDKIKINFNKQQELISTSTDQVSNQDISTTTENMQTENIVIEALLDSDNDGLLDIFETIYDTDINNPDTDGDGYQDGAEILSGYDPSGLLEINDGKDIYYFAYGSNMNIETMKSRCGDGNFVGFKNSILDNYSFYFYNRGFANIKPLLGSRVYGVLYKINQKCLDLLDRAEGYPELYQRQEVSIENNSNHYNSQVYIVENNSSSGVPTDSYFQTVIIGAQQFGLPVEYINNFRSLKE